MFKSFIFNSLVRKFLCLVYLMAKKITKHKYLVILTTRSFLIRRVRRLDVVTQIARVLDHRTRFAVIVVSEHDQLLGVGDDVTRVVVHAELVIL